MNKSERLAALAATLADCQACSLAATRQHVVFARGPASARIMLIGEGPGADEDRLGQPFVGRAGQLLDKILAAAQLPPQDIYICNVVKCRPPGNRLPQPSEVLACKGYLREQIRMVAPNIIVCLGALATQVVVDPQARITRERGQWRQKGPIWIMPTYHPAALLRDESKKRPVWQDFQAVAEKYRQILAQLAADAVRPAAGAATKE